MDLLSLLNALKSKTARAFFLKWTQPFLLLLILSLATFLRFAGLSTRAIWYDEALTIIQSEKEVSQIIKEVPTPIHYLFVHFFLFFGKNTFILGLPAVILGILSVFLIYKIGQKYINKNVGLIAAFLFALSPMHIEFSQQILHYSYFIFFSLLSLYFYIDIILSISHKKIERLHLFLFLVVSIINVLTHVSALLILAIQIIFLIFTFIFKLPKSIKLKDYIFPLIIIGLGLTIFAYIGKGYYLNLLSNEIAFEPNKPLEVGYSLTEQLHSNTVWMNLDFFKAVFSWLGLGKGINLSIYFIFSLLGIFSFIKKRTFLLGAFFIFWIIYPFVQLYFVRPSHWFEEKYFMFIIPVYLILIAAGINLVSTLLGKSVTKYIQLLIRYTNKKGIGFNQLFFSSFFQIVILLFIFSLAIHPLKIRNEYGFPEKEVPIYDWKAVYKYLNTIMHGNDRVFVRTGEGVFFNFYYPREEKNKHWFEENYFMTMDADKYYKFISENADNYFVTIPDFQDTNISGVAIAERQIKIGGFNVYKIKFKEQKPFELLPESDNSWNYYDDFRTSKYLAEAVDWRNLNSTYFGNFNLPLTYGYFDLSPNSPSQSYINYHFILPPATPNFYLIPFFTVEKNVTFKISVGSNSTQLNTIYEKKGSQTSSFQPSLLIANPNPYSGDLYLRLEFNFDRNVSYTPGENNLKSIMIHNTQQSGVSEYTTETKDGTITYTYDSQLELQRSNKWIYEAVEHTNWVQATDGVLFSQGDAKNNIHPIVYKFLFEQPVTSVTVESKIYTFDNEITILYKEKENDVWVTAKQMNNTNVKTHTFNIKTSPTTQFLVAFQCSKSGPTCQLRNIKLTAHVKSVL